MQVCTKVDQDGRFYCTSDECGRGHHGPFKDPYGFAMVRGKDCNPSRDDKTVVPEVQGDALLLAASTKLAELRLDTQQSE